MPPNDLRQVFLDFDKHLLEDSCPSAYYNALLEQGALAPYPFSMLGVLSQIEQSKQHHPEGSVWNHTLLVVDHAAARRSESSSPRILMWSALLHDLGKANTTQVRKGRITAYDHDRVGAELCEKFLTALTEDKCFIDSVTKMVRWHMQLLYVVKHLPFANLERMLSGVDMHEISLLCLCDRLGRGEMSAARIAEEEHNIALFLRECETHLALRS